MLRLKFLLQCLGHALSTQGARSLNGIVPFGDVIYQVAMDTVQRLRDIGQALEVHDGLEWAAGASPEEVRHEVESVVTEVGKSHPPRLCKAMTNYMIHFPPLLRQALKRPADPSGKTIPFGLVLESPEDLLPFLPPRVPRFRAGERPPEPLSSWQLIELLGISSFSETWLAQNTDDKSRPPAALKLCTDIEAEDVLTRHAIEMQVAQERGSLPGVVPLTGCFRDTDPPVCRFEYFAGGDLGGLIRDGQTAPNPRRTEQVTRLMQRAASIVGSLHSLDTPIIHRGLKPRNLLLHQSARGKFAVRILDLGVAALSAARLNAADKLGQIPQAEVLAASLRGSFMPQYASPQQMRGEAPDVRDDVHALGVVWYQLIVGDTAATPTGRDWIANLKKGGVPDSHIRVISACVNPRVERRPSNAKALADDFGSLLAGPTA